MSNLTSGRREPCKDNISGLRFAYMASYVKHEFYEIQGTKGSVLDSIPSTTFYPYELRSDSNTVTETMNVIQDGSKPYDQTINVSLKAQDVDTSVRFSSLMGSYFRLVLKGNNGKYKIYGLYNGLKLISVNTTTGASRSDFNGYTLSFEGREEYKAAFIDDLSSAGIIIDGEDGGGYIFQDGNNFIFQDGNNYIFN